MRVVLAKGALRGAISGASETVVTYATHLRRSGHDVSVLLVYPPAAGDPYRNRLRRQAVPVVSIAPLDVERALLAGGAAAPSLRGLPRVARSVSDAGRSLLTTTAERFAPACQEYLRATGADVVHVVGQDAGAGVVLAAAHAAGLPSLFQELGTGAQPSVFPGLRAVVASCSEVAALSPQIAERLRDTMTAAQRVCVLPIMTEAPAEMSAARPARARVTFGFAGRLDPAKGPLVMLEALARARAVMPDIELRVAGTGNAERRLLNRARELGITSAVARPGRYAGPEQRTSFMRGVDIFLLPSETEGTPNAIVEAMAHGLPVISTSVGGIPDVVTPDVGVLVPPRDADALARAMTDLAADPGRRARMGVAAVERYERLFSPASVLPLLLETYGRVAGGSAMPAGTPPHDWARCDGTRR